MTDEEKQKLLVLINKAKEGDQNAFTKLYNKCVHIVRYTIYGIMHDSAITEDLVSITFTKAWFKLASYTYHISFEMWLKTIAINSSIDYIRCMKKEQNDYRLDDEESFYQPSSSADYSPEEAYIYQETSENLTEALTHIKPCQRQLLELRTVEDLSYKEIGQRLGITESQVKSRLNVVRKKLKKLLN